MRPPIGTSHMMVSPDTFRDCWFLTGPTAAGKTEVGIELAERFGAEIVSMDSMTLYRGLDCGTAKPTPQQRRRVPYHLVDCLEPSEECSLARYLELAAEACRQVRARRRRILFVGGTALYLKALLRGIFNGPAADWELRRVLSGQADEYGAGFLHDRLRRVDPVSAERLHPNDVRRVIRALEVYEKTGVPISDQQRQFDRERANDLEATAVVCLTLPRTALYECINRRTDRMFADGLIDEVRRLASVHPPLSRVARQALGYKEVLEYLDGCRGHDETVELVKRRTRRYAKHQLTWFRSFSECRFLEPIGAQKPQALADQIAKMFGAAGQTFHEIPGRVWQ